MRTRTQSTKESKDIPTTTTTAAAVVEEEPSSREVKLYSAAQFRSHINRLYPFHLDYFTSKISALDFEQHRMGLYIFYDVRNGFLVNDLEKELKKKSDRGKNMKVRERTNKTKNE